MLFKSWDRQDVFVPSDTLFDVEMYKLANTMLYKFILDGKCVWNGCTAEDE